MYQKRQTANIIIAAATAAGDYFFRVMLDAEFKKAIGYTVYENANPGVEYQIGVKDDNGPYQNLTNSRDYIATTAVGKSDRFTSASIPADGNYVTITVSLITPSVTALNIDFVFLLTGKQGDNCENKGAGSI